MKPLFFTFLFLLSAYAERQMLIVASEPGEFPKEGSDLWVIFLGHGSFDGKTAHFNLTGEDLNSKEMQAWLEPFQRRLIVLHLFSASAPFMADLHASNRVLIASNRSSGQRNYSRFGEYLASYIDNHEADLDLDGSTSLLEACLYASSATTEFYENEQRLVTEHATINDNGDKSPTELRAFQGLTTDKTSKESDSPDGLIANNVFFDKRLIDPLAPEQQKTRAAIEKKIFALRKKKKTIDEDQYYDQLEVLFRAIAKLYAE